MKGSWYKHSYRRLLLDMHVPAWDERFLKQFEPQAYVNAALTANASAVTVFSNTHTGLANFPSKVGPMHPAFRGRDNMGEVIALCRKHGLSVTSYYCVNYVDWYWDNHPDARTVDAEGQSRKVLMASAGHPRRFSVCCMNHSGYRDFAAAQLAEISQAYDFDALTLDMTFWSTVCYCASCRRRYKLEVGAEIPTVVDWYNPEWVRFQRRRQAWLVEFTHAMRSAVTALKPAVPVTHQSLQYTVDWVAGGSLDLAAEADWLSADLYRDKDSLTFLFNMFKHLSNVTPFEAISTWCYPNIFEHVVTRTPEELRVTAFRPLAHHGATVFIDAVDPLGLIAERTYARVAPIYADLARYEPYAVGRPCEDIAVYVSLDANFDTAENGIPVAVLADRAIADQDRRTISPSAHLRAALQATKSLVQHHLPVGVITARQLSRLQDYQVVVLPNVVTLSDEENAAFRAYVRDGGSLYASKATSLVDTEGHLRPDFGLADLFGVHYSGETTEVLTYVAPTAAAGDLFGEFNARYPMTVVDTQVLASTPETGTVLATITLPYTDPRDTRYASLLTDPPGRATSSPAVTRQSFGRGSVIYTAGALEICEHDSQRAAFVGLVRSLVRKNLAFEMAAPKCVEAMVYFDEEGSRYMINLLNVQSDLPNIPISGLSIRVRLDGSTPRSLVRLPEREALDYVVAGDCITFVAPSLETFEMLELAVDR